MGDDTTTQSPPRRIELLGIEPLEEHARRLAALLTVSVAKRGGRAHLKGLRGHTRTLRDVYTSLTEDAKLGEPSSPAAETTMSCTNP